MQLLLLTNQPPSCFTKKSSKRIPNYQLYAVEKWCLQRRHTTLLVVYTGNPHHLITLDAYEPHSQRVWDETIALFRADGARPRHTPDGVLMVTSLAHFRSDYTIVQIPEGDFNQVKDQLYANINLLRLGCSGRTALTLEDPSESTKERFISLYSLPGDPQPRPNNSTSSLPSRNARSRESFVTTVLELVKLIQAGLALFGMPNMSVLPHNLVFDGLLCDDTVQGIQLWTSHIGGPCVGLEPTQRTADPLFVSALLSLVLSIRNKLAYLGYNHLLPRDPFLYPYAFSLAISSFLQSPSASSSGPHQTFSSPPAGHAIHIPSLIPAAPPPTNFFSAAASAAAAVLSSPTSLASTFPAGAILTRDVVQSITLAYDTKLKAENRKVRRVIKNKLVVGVDSDGDNNSGIDQQRRQHTLSMSTLSGGEGPSSIATERSPSNPVSNTPSANAGGASATGTAGSSSGQILSGIASGLGLSAGGEATIIPTIDLSSFVASVLRSSAGSGGSGSHNSMSRRERRKKEKDRNSLSLRAGESIDLGLGGVGANITGAGSSGTSLGFYYERDKDANAIGGTVRALWSGRISDLVKMREEAEGVISNGLTSRSVSSSVPGSNFGPGGSLRPPALHRRSRSSDATKWSKEKQEQQDRNRRQMAAGGVASDGDREAADYRYDGRSTEEESDVFLNPSSGAVQSFGGMWSGRVRGKLGTWAGLAKRKNQSVDLGSSGMTSGVSSVKGKERDTDKEASVSKDRSASLSVPQSQSQPPSRGTSPAASPSQLSKLAIGSSPSINQNPRRPSISRRSTTVMAPGAQSPTLPPMVFSHDLYSDDDLLSSGQVSPLSDYRPNPFTMLGKNNTTKSTLTGGADGSSSNLYLGTATGANSSGINLQDYERTLERLVRQKKLPSWATRKPQQAQARVASWADPVSAKDEEGEVEEDTGDVEVEGEEDTGEEGSATAGKKRRRRDGESEGDDSDISRLGSVYNNSGKGKAKAGSKADAVFKSRRREKARFHSLMSVMDGEGVLVEEPLGTYEEEEDGYEDEDEMGTESDDEWWDGDLSRPRGRRRSARGFDMQRRRSFHDLETFSRAIEVLTPEQMKIDVDLCGHLLVMRRREPHIKNVLTVAGLIAKSISKTNTTLREHYQTHVSNLAEIDRASSILADIDAARLRSVKILQSTNTLQYESAQFQVDDDLWQTVRPARHKVFELREKVFGANGAAGAGASGSRRLPPGVHGAHGSFNRLQWTLDSQPRLVDHLGRTESEAEEESMFDERGSGGYRDGQPLTPASVGGELPSLEEEAEGNVVEHPGIKPMWLLRFFTSWGARWSAVAATPSGGAAGVTSSAANRDDDTFKGGKDEKTSSSSSPDEQQDQPLARSTPSLVNKPVANKEAAKELPRPASH